KTAESELPLDGVAAPEAPAIEAAPIAAPEPEPVAAQQIAPPPEPVVAPPPALAIEAIPPRFPASIHRDEEQIEDAAQILSRITSAPLSAAETQRNENNARFAPRQQRQERQDRYEPQERPQRQDRRERQDYDEPPPAESAGDSASDSRQEPIF